MKNILLSALVFCSTSISAFAGTWIYPTGRSHEQGLKGSMHVHVYANYDNVAVFTGDSGNVTNKQYIVTREGIAIGEKDAPQQYQNINGIVYAVYDYGYAVIFHAGKTQAAYLP